MRPAARVLKKPTFAVSRPKNGTRRATFEVETIRPNERGGGKRRFYCRLPKDFVNGGRERTRRGERGALVENRLLRRGACETFEFRGKFVLLNFVVHRFLANAEFTRGETTATVASDERFEKSEPFDLRQR